jgi:hypothetical protein
MGVLARSVFSLHSFLFRRLTDVQRVVSSLLVSGFWRSFTGTLAIRRIL